MFVRQPYRMSLLYAEATDFHQLPSLILIPQAPRWVRWMLDEAVLHWRSARETAEKTAAAMKPAPGAPIGVIEGDQLRLTTGAMPWVDDDD